LLQARSKWRTIQPNIQVGDTVLVADSNTPRGEWPLGIIDEVKVSDDKLVRSVTVKTARGLKKRPITQLIKLEQTGLADNPIQM
jgi:hypothetical protein